MCHKHYYEIMIYAVFFLDFVSYTNACWEINRKDRSLWGTYFYYAICLFWLGWAPHCHSSQDNSIFQVCADIIYCVKTFCFTLRFILWEKQILSAEFTGGEKCEIESGPLVFLDDLSGNQN